MFSRRAQRHTSLLALFVLLWGLVFPSLAQAGVGGAHTVWTEICTAQGIKKIQQGTDDVSTSGQHVTAQHCVLCCLGGVLAATEAPSMLGGVSLEPQSLSLPPLHVALPEQFILLTAPPRAPPFLSQA